MALLDKKVELITECYNETKKLQEKLKLLEEIDNTYISLWGYSNTLTTIISNLESQLGKILLSAKNDKLAS